MDVFIIYLLGLIDPAYFRQNPYYDECGIWQMRLKSQIALNASEEACTFHNQAFLIFLGQNPEIFYFVWATMRRHTRLENEETQPYKKPTYRFYSTYQLGIVGTNKSHLSHR